jgi:malonyl-CoA O-methyltransferase
LAGKIRAVDLPENPRVLEIGCGTGLLTQALADSFPGADWLASDIAPAMVERARERFGPDPRYRFALLDGEHPRLDEPPFDLICSSLAVQWFDDLQAGLERLFRLLRPGGHLAFSTLAEGSFAEWRDAHAELGLEHGMRTYPSSLALESLRLGQRTGSIDREWFDERHATGLDFLKSLRSIGADTPRPGHVPLGPGRMRNMLRRFERSGAVARYHVAFGLFAA